MSGNCLKLGALLCALSIVRVSAQSPSDSARSVPVAPLTRVPATAWGANVIVIDSAEIAKSMAQGFSELLQARRPGVSVLQSGGMASDGALIMLRGPTSLLGQSPPLVIVDGVRVDSRQSDTSLGGVSQPSRLDDILPEDIGRIEILSGAAAALYGDGAANGVILVTTKSGGRGPLRFSGRATWDARRTADEFPANYQRIGVSPSTGQPVSDCSLVAVENGQCTPTGLDVWNPLEQASPFHIGNSARAHLELGGTSLGTALSFGVTGDRRQGTLPHDDGARIGARGKLSHDLPWRFGVDASGSYLRDNARLGSSLLASGLLGTAQNDANRGYDTFGALNDSLIPDQRLRHATGGIRLNWHPLDWLEAAVMSGRDRVTNDGRFDLFGPPPQTGLANSFAYEEHAVTTSNAHVGASYHVWRGVAATTGIGYERDIVHARTADSTVFSGLVSYAETAYHLRSTAAWINEQVTLSKELAIGAAAERITSSVLGSGGAKEWFPSANVSWTPSLRARAVSNLRVRAAYAEVANPTQSLIFLALQVAPPTLGLTPQPPPKMERTRHLELGADATLGSSTLVSVTAFDSRSTHLWATNNFQGFGTVSQVGELSNKGIDAMIAAPLVDIPAVRWTASLSLAVLHNDVTHLGLPPTFLTTGSVVQGKPYGGIFGTTYSYADTNHDGIIGTGEVTFGSYDYVGPPLPTFESALATDFTFPGRLVLSANFDYRTGNRVVSATEASRCAALICRASQDPNTSLDDQAGAVAAFYGGQRAASSMEDATFLRLREIALRWPLPVSLAGVLGTHTELTIAGRNLATWSRYRGLDPEISIYGAAQVPRIESMRLPLPRQFIVRVEFGR